MEARFQSDKVSRWARTQANCCDLEPAKLCSLPLLLHSSACRRDVACNVLPPALQPSGLICAVGRDVASYASTDDFVEAPPCAIIFFF
jgi:hypothetical protein